jgi:WD40 repeat protein
LVSVSGKSYAVAEGLITFRQDGTDRWLETWDPNTETVVHTIGNAWTVVAVHTDAGTGTSVVAWIPTSCPARSTGFCDLSLTELPSNRTHTIAAPVNSFGFMGGGAFSPDGRTLAAMIDVSSRFAADPRGQLVLVDTMSDELRRVAGSTLIIGEPYAYVVWTPDGSQLVFGGLDDTAKIYRLTDSVARDTKIPGSYSLTIVSG